MRRRSYYMYVKHASMTGRPFSHRFRQEISHGAASRCTTHAIRHQSNRSCDVAVCAVVRQLPNLMHDVELGSVGLSLIVFRHWPIVSAAVSQLSHEQRRVSIPFSRRRMNDSHTDRRMGIAFPSLPYSHSILAPPIALRDSFALQVIPTCAPTQTTSILACRLELPACASRDCGSAIVCFHVCGVITGTI